MLYLIAIVPVLVYILMMLWLDSFSLVKKGLLAYAFIWGMMVSLIAPELNELMLAIIPDQSFITPISEEVLKGFGVLLLIRLNRTAFYIDAAIYGAAVGAGFALVENIYYVWEYPEMLLGTALVRGFSTSIMHCGSVACTAVMLCWIAFYAKHSIRHFFIALFPAVVLHGFYNSLVLPPVMSLLFIVLGVTSLLITLFKLNEKSIGQWLDTEMAEETALLAAMKKGEFSTSPAGEYMLSIRKHFKPDVYFDLFCYVRLYLELSILAKGNMMIREAGLNIGQNPETEVKVIEFWNLRKRIGRIGIAALTPIVRIERMTTWKIRQTNCNDKINIFDYIK